jgi:uncharacterized membrane protein
MAACAIGLVPIVVATVDRLHGRRLDVLLATAFVAVSPVLLGSLTISRYDLWPALLTALAMLAVLAGRFRWAFAILALAVLAKVYPAFLIPVFMAQAWRMAGRREAIIDTAIGAIVGLAGMVPFVALDEAGALDPFARFIARPLQVESIGASVLAALHGWLGPDTGRVVYTYFSYNLAGPLPSAIAGLQTGALILVLGAIWLMAARGPADPGRFVVLCAAALAANVALGKVLSPQYVLWLVPAVAALVVVRGARPLALLGVILALTQLYYPSMYQRYLRFDGTATLALLERNLGLVVLAAYLLVATGLFGWLASTWQSRGRRSPAP